VAANGGGVAAGGRLAAGGWPVCDEWVGWLLVSWLLVARLVECKAQGKTRLNEPHVLEDGPLVVQTVSAR
jgi:hypothetical protein